MYAKAVTFLGVLTAVLAGVINQSFEDVQMPDSCLGTTYCFEKSNKYPQKLIDSIVDSLGIYEVRDQVQYRNGSQTSVEHICDREIRFEPIYEMLDKNGMVRYVAQSDKFQQSIRTESCVSPGRITENSEKARFFRDYQLMAYNFSCVEKRIEYSFLTLSLDQTSLEDVDVMGGLPVCCSCQFSELEYLR